MIAAASIGLSLGGAWLCAVVSFGVTSEDKVRGLYFILGRIVGLVFLGLAIATFGFFADLPPLYFVVVFGALSIVFGIIVISQSTGHWERFAGVFKKNRMTEAEHASNLGNHGGKGKCKGGMKEGQRMRRFKNRYIFALGIARGATPCLKVMILVPLLVSVDIYLALAMILVYALASTIYPVIGFLSGNLLQSAERHAAYVRVAAALVLIVVGVYSIINVLTQTHTGGI